MKKAFKFIGALLSFIIVITVVLYVQMNEKYIKIIDMNWSIKLPDLCKETYYIDSGASFHGDGERYTIFQYARENEINQSVNWENNKNKSIETKIDKILSTLNIPKENIPDFKSNYKYYATQKDDSSKIYLIFITNTKKLYVIEDIY